MAESFSHYDVYTVTGSIYCYWDTNIRRNRLGIRANQQLRIVEADMTAVRQNDLLERDHPKLCVNQDQGV